MDLPKIDLPQVVLNGQDIKELIFECVVISFFFWLLANANRRSFIIKAIIGKNDRLDYDELAMTGFLLLTFIIVLGEVFVGRIVRMEVFLGVLIAGAGSEGLSIIKDIFIAKFTSLRPKKDEDTDNKN